MKHAAATLGSGNLRNAVALPDGEDLNEWVAVNSKSFPHRAVQFFFFLIYLQSNDNNCDIYIVWQPLIFSIK